jgi:hypothetical protein
MLKSAEVLVFFVMSYKVQISGHIGAYILFVLLYPFHMSSYEALVLMRVMKEGLTKLTTGVNVLILTTILVY